MSDYITKRRQAANPAEAAQNLAAETFLRVPVSLYRYVEIVDPHKMRERLYDMWEELDCFGRIYLAQEGINAQMSVPEHNLEAFKQELYSLPEFTDVPLKIGVENGDAFIRLQIKIKNQIVADGLSPDDYDITNVGNHMTAAEFNAAMDDPETIVVDMRNHYESEIGYFDGAITPPVDTFREELPLVAEELAEQKDKKVLLYCTGGIRCEKASAYLKHKGFKDVNQLHGGVIDYKHQIEREGLENKFKGANYVFDGRGQESINGEIISHCHQCNELCNEHVNCSNRACNLLFLQCADCVKKMDTACSKKCQKIFNLPKEKRDKYYKKHGNMTSEKFSKSLRARQKLSQTSPWQKIVSIFS